MKMNVDEKKQQNDEENTQTKSSLSLFQTIMSVLWAMLGIQSKENLKRDFAHGKAQNFIITGLIFVALFVCALILIVKLVLHFAL